MTRYDVMSRQLKSSAARARVRAIEDIVDFMEGNPNVPISIWNGVLDMLDEAESDAVAVKVSA